MSLSTPLQIALVLIAAFVAVAIIKTTIGTRFHCKTPTPLKKGFIYAKATLLIRATILWLCLFAPLYILLCYPLTDWNIAITFISFMTITALIPPELSTAPNTKLVITKPLLSHTATLHLKAPYQRFDRQTYQELFALVECLPQYGIKKIALNSPMFYDTNGKLRNMRTLERALNKHGARLTHSPAGVFDCLLGKISMLASRDKQKHIKKHNVTLLKWHKIVITL